MECDSAVQAGSAPNDKSATEHTYPRLRVFTMLGIMEEGIKNDSLSILCCMTGSYGLV